MENFKPENNIEANKDTFDRHSSFFSSERIKNFIGNSMVVTGSVMALAGIFEMATGEKIEHLLAEFKDTIPNLINWAIDHLDSIPVIMKTGAGSSLILGGLGLGRHFDTKKNSNEDSQ